MCRQEVGDLFEELVEGWRACKQRMIASRQLDETRSRDELGQIATLLERRYTIARAVKHQRRNPHLAR